MSWPLTLESEIAAAEARDPQEAAALIDQYAVFPALVTGPAYSVYAPCCGRRVAADQVIDARTVPGTVVRGRDHDWLCDGCWARMIRDPANGWKQSSWFRAVGAPAEVIRNVRAQEVAEEKIAALPKGTPFNRVAERAAALAALPENTRDLPGTAHPITGR